MYSGTLNTALPIPDLLQGTLVRSVKLSGVVPLM
jgi:hypothetical protein